MSFPVVVHMLSWASLDAILVLSRLRSRVLTLILIPMFLASWSAIISEIFGESVSDTVAWISMSKRPFPSFHSLNPSLSFLLYPSRSRISFACFTSRVEYFVRYSGPGLYGPSGETDPGEPTPIQKTSFNWSRSIPRERKNSFDHPPGPVLYHKVVYTHIG